MTLKRQMKNLNWGCGGKGDKETTDQVQRSQKMCESRTASLFVAGEWDAQWGE